MSLKKSNHPGLIILFRVIFALTTLAIMTYIFMLSAESAVQSSQTSSGLIVKIVDTFVPSYKEMSIVEKQTFVASLQGIVRKLAHLTIFGALGFSVSCFASTFKGKFFIKLIFCQIFCSLYAVSDEYHQTFSKGRSCQISDIAIDSLGSFCGIIFVLLIVLVFVRIRNRGGDKVRKRDLLKQLQIFENKLMEADSYIKELTDLVANKDNEIRRLNDKLDLQLANNKQLKEAKISSEDSPLEQDVTETVEITEPVKSEYHDFDFADSVVAENSDDINTYAVKVIGKIVTESVKIGCVLASSENENKKELLNLTLGRTEVAKNEISSLVTTGLDSDLIKASIDKEYALVMEYYQSILAQL